MISFQIDPNKYSITSLEARKIVESQYGNLEPIIKDFKSTNSIEDIILKILVGIDKYPNIIPIKNEHEFQLCIAGIISQYGNLGWNIRTKDNTYIDLTLGDSIAIELKMNPDRNELNRLIGQCSNYLKWYRYLIVLILWDKTTILEVDTSILSKFVYFKHIRLNPIIVNSTGQKQLVI